MNANQGFVMCILTFVYVAATIVIVIMNKKSIGEMEKARKEESRPYIIANLVKDPRDRCFYLRIKNYGRSGAVVNNFSVTPEINIIKDTKEGLSLKNCLLAPSQSIQFIILEEWEKTCETEYSVTLSYTTTGSSSDTFEETYTMITRYAHQMGYTTTKKSNLSDCDNALSNIADALDSIRNKIRKLQVQVGHPGRVGAVS
jgi:hypothetical protein